jgi:hypothetical protein
MPDSLVEQRAVGQVGDRVVERLVSQLLLERLALGDVTAIEHDAADVLVGTQVVEQDLEVAGAAVRRGEHAFHRLARRGRP